MTVAQLKDMLEGLRERATDFEDAHGYEDTIREAVLYAIAHGTAEDPKRMALLALSTSSISFPRHCA